MSVDTAPDGFYAVCAIGRGGVAGCFWAAWWTSRGLAVSPTPDAHGLTEKVEEAHARARAAILEARGPRATVLRVDAELAVQAARLVRPVSEGYYVGASAWTDDPAWRQHGAASGRGRSPRAGEGPRPWLGVLGLAWPCTAVEVRKAYRRLARERHPDRGGTAAAFDALTKARDAALLELSER